MLCPFLPSLSTVLGPITVVLAAILSVNNLATVFPGSHVHQVLQILAMLLSMISFLDLRHMISTIQRIRLTDLAFRPFLSHDLAEDVICKSTVRSWEVCIDGNLELTATFSCLLIFCAMMLRLSHRKTTDQVENVKGDGGQAVCLRELRSWQVVFLVTVLLQYAVFIIYQLGFWMFDQAGVVLSQVNPSQAPLWERIGVLVYLLCISMAACVCACLIWRSMTCKEGKEEKKERAETEGDPMEEKLKWETGPDYATCTAV